MLFATKSISNIDTHENIKSKNGQDKKDNEKENFEKKDNAENISLCFDIDDGQQV